MLVVAPLVGGYLAASFHDTIGKYLPAQAGMAVVSVPSDPRRLAPGTGYGALLAYVAVALVAGVDLLIRRDA